MQSTTIGNTKITLETIEGGNKTVSVYRKNEFIESFEYERYYDAIEKFEKIIYENRHNMFYQLSNV